MYNMTTSIKKITWCCGVLLLLLPIVCGTGGTVEYYETAYGVPDASVNQAECETYGGSMYKGLFSTPGGPPGCMKLNGSYWYNTGTGDCSTSNMCIKTKKKLMFPTFEKTSGSPLTGDFALNEAGCKQYATSVGKGFSIGHESDWTKGCFRHTNGKIYHNGDLTSTKDCVSTYSNACIHKAPFQQVSGAATGDMSQTECEAYATSVPWAVVNSGSANTYVEHFSSSAHPGGCYQTADNKIAYNTNTASTTACGTETCLSFRPNADVVDTPEVSWDLSMTERECEAYAASFDPAKTYSLTASTWYNYPLGCFRIIANDAILYNPSPYTSSAGCNMYMGCIKKPVVIPKVWEFSSGPPVISSGPPDLSLSEAECWAYAKSIGDIKLYKNSPSEPKGCYREYSNGQYNGNIWYNAHPTSSGSCTSEFRCFQKAPAVEEVTSGAPDLSMTASECQAYGESIGGWKEKNDYPNIPSGCFINTYEDIYYNTAVTTQPCGSTAHHGAQHDCIQKVDFLNVPGCIDSSYAPLGNYNPYANEDDNSCACKSGNIQRSGGACVCLAGYYHNVAADTCNEKLVCTTSGYYTKDNGVANSECAPCTGQTWDNNNPAAATCTAHTVTDSNKQTQCSVTGGETDVDGLEWFQFTPGSATTDSSCSQCPTGYEATVLTTLASGTSCDKCAAGYGNDGTGNGCALCVASKYNPGYTSLATYCADKACPKGQGIGTAQGSDEIDDCVSCTAGFYSTSETTGQCQVCDDTLNKQTQTSQVVGESHVVNSAHYCIDCPAGYDNSNGGVCDPCVSGKWSVQGGTCNDWVSCASGKYSTTTPSSTVNRNCQTFSLLQENVLVAIGEEYADRSWTSAVGKMLTTDGITWVDVPIGAVRTDEDTWATGNDAIESAWYSHAHCDSQANAGNNYHPDDPVSATPGALDATKVGLILATNDPIAWYQSQIGKVYLGNGVFLDCPIYSVRVGNSCSDQKAAFENAWDSQCA